MRLREDLRATLAAVALFVCFFGPFCYLLFSLIHSGLGSFDITAGPAYSGGGMQSMGVFVLLLTGSGSCFFFLDLLDKIRGLYWVSRRKK